MKSVLPPVLSFLIALAISLAAKAQIEVLDVVYNGTGCPAGTVSAAFAPGTTQFSLLYSAFSLEVGGQEDKKDRGNCEVIIKLNLPEKTALIVESADFRGYAFLDAGVKARHQIEVQTGPDKLSTFGFDREALRGPMDDNFYLRLERPYSKPNKLHCHRIEKRNQNRKVDAKIKIRTRFHLKGGGPNKLGMITVDSLDGTLEQRYVLGLKTCE